MNSTVITPEHMALLSTRKLQAVASEYDNDPQPLDEDTKHLRQLARLELRRRHMPIQPLVAASSN